MNVRALARSALSTSSHRIITGLVAGVAVGLFLGDRAAPLGWVADAYVKLLQMTVLPFVTVSIVGGLGTLRRQGAVALGLRTGAVLVLLWVTALIFMYLIPLAFPRTESASFFSTTLVAPRQSFNFIDLYIPSNPFRSLSESVVPAVVLFSVLVGVALIGIENKQPLIDLLAIAREVLSRITRGVTALTPIGLFAIAATMAGTLSLDQLQRLQVYLIAYVMVALLMTLWVLPGLISALTGVPMREIFRASRDGLMTAFAVADLFIVLPVLIKAAGSLCARYTQSRRDVTSLPDVIVPASFNFPHTAKLLSLSFILFAAWFTDTRLTAADYPSLTLTTFLVAFGSVTSAVLYLLDLFRIPADTYQLFVGSSVINSHFGSLLAAMHTMAVGILGSCATVGALQVRRRPIVRYLVITGLLTFAVIGGLRLLFERVLDPQYTMDRVLTRMHLMTTVPPPIVHREYTPPDGSADGDVLDTIRARGRLRVGYLSNALPFAFFNEQGELVGHDIELATDLAAVLGVSLELVPVAREHVREDLASGYCDIVMSGVPVTTDLAEVALMSRAYLDETLAFVVPDGSRGTFTTWDEIRAAGPIRIAVPDVRYYVEKLRMLLPGANLMPVPDATRYFTSKMQGIDGVAFPAERGSAWTLLYPEYSVVVPEPDVMKVPLAFALARQDHRFAEFVNTWIELKQKDGTLDRVYRYWILGEQREAKKPRWSIMRNVLGWGS